MYVKTKSGRKVLLNTPEEDAAITTAAESDPDAVPLTDQEWEAVRPTLQRGTSSTQHSPKVATTISFDADVLAALQAGGPGWQARVNDAMREWLKSHPEGR